jgi:3-oxoacyl-[acyl-carrier-protein] synthase II
MSTTTLLGVPPAATITRRRVVISGLAVATALGLEVDAMWRGLLAGACGISPLPVALAGPELPVRIAGQVDDATLTAGLQRYGIDERDRNGQLGLYVVGRALEDAGHSVDGKAPLDLDVIVGSGHGAVAVSNAATRAYVEGGWRRVRPTAVVRTMFNRPASLASIQYRLTGTSFVVSAACASGAVALGEAFLRVALGVSDGAVAACCDTGLDPATFVAWNRLGVLSRIPDPARASRPFDIKRDGLVIGEGAAAFVLEPRERAERRGARIWAEILGYGCASDATHIVRPDTGGQVRAIRAALRWAGIEPEALDYVSAHGTATELADIAEAAALREALGEHGARVPVSSTKAQLGHLMGATAGVELASTVLALRHGLLPPCRNLDDPDPRCPLNFVRGEPLAAPGRVALKNSFAFGGTSCAVVLAG